MNTLIVGFANGVVGIWDLNDGSRLVHTRLYGAVVHLLIENNELYVATDLGRYLVWDLKVFYRDYCQLLRKVWKQVAVVWKDGRAVQRDPPRDHPCRKR